MIAPGEGLGRRSSKRGRKPRVYKRNLPVIFARVMAVLVERGCPRHDEVHFEQFITYCVSNTLAGAEIPDQTIRAWALAFEDDLTHDRKQVKIPDRRMS